MITGPLVCRGNQLQCSTSLIPIKMNNACSKILVIKGKNIECKLNGLNQWIILQTAILRNWKKVLFKSINILITLQFYFSYINKKHPICCFPSPEKQRTAAFPNILSSTGINYQAVDIYKLVSQAREAAEDISASDTIQHSLSHKSTFWIEGHCFPSEETKAADSWVLSTEPRVSGWTIFLPSMFRSKWWKP